MLAWAMTCNVGLHCIHATGLSIITCLVQVDAEGRCQQRSLKYFQGLAHGCWLLSWDWLEACSKAGAWLPEYPFQVRGDLIAMGAPDKGACMALRLQMLLCCEAGSERFRHVVKFLQKPKPMHSPSRSGGASLLEMHPTRLRCTMLRLQVLLCCTSGS